MPKYIQIVNTRSNDKIYDVQRADDVGNIAADLLSFPIFTVSVPSATPGDENMALNNKKIIALRHEKLTGSQSDIS